MNPLLFACWWRSARIIPCHAILLGTDASTNETGGLAEPSGRG